MVSQLAADHPDRLAAIAPVAGLRAGAPSPADPRLPDPATCTPGVPVPVVTFHGTADPFNVFTGGGEPYWGYSAPAALARWAELNGCARRLVQERLTEHVSVQSYPACAGGADVMMYVVEGGGHTWPGSRATFPATMGPVTQEISANELMWQFFAGRSR
jgi:polyhydroxybutyrate depolymerase